MGSLIIADAPTPPQYFVKYFSRFCGYQFAELREERHCENDASCTRKHYMYKNSGQGLAASHYPEFLSILTANGSCVMHSGRKNIEMSAKAGEL